MGPDMRKSPQQKQAYATREHAPFATTAVPLRINQKSMLPNKIPRRYVILVIILSRRRPSEKEILLNIALAQKDQAVVIKPQKFLGLAYSDLLNLEGIPWSTAPDAWRGWRGSTVDTPRVDGSGFKEIGTQYRERTKRKIFDQDALIRYKKRKKVSDYT